MTATLSDIAKQAGVSTMTASRALRGMGRVNPLTREKVVQIAQQLGYKKFSNGQVLSSGQAGTDLHLRVVVGCNELNQQTAECYPNEGDFEKHSLHSRLVGELSSLLSQSGGKLICIPMISFKQIKNDILKHKPHGLVLRQPIPTSWLNELKDILPVIYAVSYDHQSGVDSVYTNEHRSAAMIYQKLTDLGHRDIGWFGIVDRHCSTHQWSEMFESDCLVDRLSNSIHSVRYAAWANLAHCQLHSYKQPMILVERDWRLQSLEDVVRDGVDQFLQLRPQPTAIVVPADQIGLTAIEILKQRGLRVPEDISVIGYGGTYIELGEKSLIASIALPMADIGRTIPELIRRRLADPQALPVSMQLETKFIEGASLGPSRHQI